MEKRDEVFSFTYNAAQQAEVEKIRSKYAQPQEDKLGRLRRLDRSASRKAQIWALTLGIIGALIMGTGMSLVMTDLSALIGSPAIPVGIVVGLAGMVMVALAYPVYNAFLQKERMRIAPEVLRLTEELLSGSQQVN